MQKLCRTCAKLSVFAPASRFPPARNRDFRGKRAGKNGPSRVRLLTGINIMQAQLVGQYHWERATPPSVWHGQDITIYGATHSERAWPNIGDRLEKTHGYAQKGLHIPSQGKREKRATPWATLHCPFEMHSNIPTIHHIPYVQSMLINWYLKEYEPWWDVTWCLQVLISEGIKYKTKIST